MPFSIIPFLLLVLPLLEIAVFIAVGQQIGVLATLALVLLTTVAGSILLRRQGFGNFQRIRHTLEQGRMPERELIHAFMILVAGVLLLTPGFVTDALGFMLFIPAVRDLAWASARKRFIIVGSGTSRSKPYRGGPETRTIDLDTGDYSNTGPRDSPWRNSEDNRNDR